MISNKTKKEMREELEAFRINFQASDVVVRLDFVPFMKYHFKSRDLFNIQDIPKENFTKAYQSNLFACEIFGRHLVLKIIDELLE